MRFITNLEEYNKNFMTDFDELTKKTLEDIDNRLWVNARIDNEIRRKKNIKIKNIKGYK
jgi:hypothetical protein